MDAFYWMVGEESSDPVVIHRGTLVRVDQMDTTGHFGQMEDDLRSVQELGIRYVRYGINWRRTEPEPGTYVWDLWDRAFAAFDRLGLEMVVDLLHFGAPDWLSGIADTRLPDAFLRYVEAFLARYQGPTWFTPVNEPYITSFFSTGIGIWNESVCDEPLFVRTLAQLCLADLRAAAAIRSDRSATFLHSEAFGHDAPADATESAIRAAERKNAFRWLSFDLRYGQDPHESIREDVDLLDDFMVEEIRNLAFVDGVIAGHDFYPISAPSDRSYADMARDFYRRYPVPFMIAETSNLGLDPAEGPRWLSSLCEQGFELRHQGLPFVGICWYSRGDQHDWHTTLTSPVKDVTPVGLFDIDRRPRPAAEALRSLVRRPVPRVDGGRSGPSG